MSVEARSGADSGVMVLAIELPVAWRADWEEDSPEKETPESLVILWMVEVLWI